MPSAKDFAPSLADNLTATIAASGTTSAAVDLSGCTLCGVFIPSSFTGTTLSFQAATSEAGTYVSMRDGAGNAYSKTVAANQYIPLDPSDFSGIRFLKVVSGSTEASQRVITLAARPV